MWYLVWSIACSSLIFVVFKLYGTYRVSTYYAIVINYLTAFAVGMLLFPSGVPISDIPGKGWFPAAMALGVLFIVIFNLMARTSQQMGVSVASIAAKMSLVIPVVAGVWLYGEHLDQLKVIGVVLALVAVYLASVRQKNRKWESRLLLLPALVFLGSGIIDTSIKYMEQTLVPEREFPLFSAFLFASAGAAGILMSGLREPAALLRFRPRNLLGGIALGIPNFFSIYFLMKALRHEGLNSASIFTLNNVAIVMLTTLLGIGLFAEKLTARNWLGVALAIVSILIISLS